jgi:beta-barrel assembly-enhancing protease
LTARTFSRLSLALLLMLAAEGRAAPAREAGDDAAFAAERALDQRIATIGYRLATADLALCGRQQWLPGFVVQDLSQYGRSQRAAAIRIYGLDRGPGVLVLAAGGPGERAGLRRDDTLVALDGVPLRGPAPGAAASSPFDQLLDAIDQAFADGRADLRVQRGAERIEVTVAAARGCASRFELVGGGGLRAWSDGRSVKVTIGLALYASDDAELAAVLAHEFAHNILGHQARLDAARAARGLFGNFGRSARLIRDTEAEADRFSIYLLDRAGYDPEAAVRFWTRFGPRGLRLPGDDPTHPGWRQRVASLTAEVAAIRAARAAGRVPVPPFTPAGVGA